MIFIKAYILCCSLSNYVFIVQFKHDFFYFINHFMKLCILHFDLIPFDIFRASDWFHAHKMFDPCWQKTGSSGFWRADIKKILNKSFLRPDVLVLLNVCWGMKCPRLPLSHGMCLALSVHAQHQCSLAQHLFLKDLYGPRLWASYDHACIHQTSFHSAIGWCLIAKQRFKFINAILPW